VEDDHVDRPGVEAPQGVELTGTNSSIGLIALINAMLILASGPGSRAATRGPDGGWPTAAKPCFATQWPALTAVCAQVGRENRL
jgi:hypothetical protein